MMQTVTDNTSSQNILVVDDEPDFLKDISASLKRGGYRVFARNDAREAIEEGAKNHVDIILADIRLPGPMDGWQVIREVKSFSPDADSIAITAFYEPEFRQKSQRLGLFACVEKPVSLDLLTKLVWSCAENRRLRMELDTLQRCDGGAEHRIQDRKKQSLLQAAMDALPFSVFIITSNGSLVLDNSAGREFLKRHSAETNGNDAEALPIEALDSAQAAIREAQTPAKSSPAVESSLSICDTD